jgi:hypothetical protein
VGVDLVDLFEEGIFAPAVRIRIDGPDEAISLVARLEVLQCPRFRVWYLPILEVRDPRFRTVDGIGVGSTVLDAKERSWTDARGWAADRALDEEAANFPLIRLVFHGLDRECEGCPPPVNETQVTAVRLMLPFPRLREQRCAESMP